MKKVAWPLLLVALTAWSVPAAGFTTAAFKADLTRKVSPAATRTLGSATFTVDASDVPDVQPMNPAEESNLYDGGAGFLRAEAWKKKALHYTIDLGASAGSAASASLHLGKSSRTEGPVVATLELGTPAPAETGGSIAKGTITAEDLQGPLAGASVQDLVNAIQAGNIYLSVLPSMNPQAEVLGQVAPA